MDVGSWIKARRDALGLTPEDLARQLDTVVSGVLMWESGSKPPHPATLARLEAILGPRGETPAVVESELDRTQLAFAARERLFTEAVLAAVGATKETAKNKAFGVSNSAKVIYGGLQLAVLNLERFEATSDGYVLLGVLRFAPDDEVLFAVHVRDGVVDMSRRLEEMRNLGEAPQVADGDVKYAAKNNNVGAYLGRNASLFLRNKGFWDSLPDDVLQTGTRTPVEHIYTATWSPSGPMGAGALEFIRHLNRLMSGRCSPLFPWGTQVARHPALAAATQQSQVIALVGAEAIQTAIQHVLAVHEVAATELDPHLFVDPALGMAQSIGRAAQVARDTPNREVWLIQRLPEESARRWLQGLQLAVRLRVPLELGVGSAPANLPTNLVVACVVDQSDHAWPVPTVNLAA